MHQVDPPHCADFGRVVDEADVSLGGGVKLSHLDVPKAIEELRPDVGPHPVADSDAHFVILFVVFLQGKKKKTAALAPSENKDPVCTLLLARGFHHGRNNLCPT